MKALRSKALLFTSLWASFARGQDVGNAGTAGHAHSDKTGMSCRAGSLIKDGENSRNDGAHAIATEVVTVATNVQTNNIKGFNTYRINLHLGPKALSVYTIFGSSQPMIFPPAYNHPLPFGSDVGAVMPVMWSIHGQEDARYDSWLTIGEKTSTSKLSTTGLNFKTWGLNKPLRSEKADGGAVLFMAADDGTPCFSPEDPTVTNPCVQGPRSSGDVTKGRVVLIAQLTLDARLGSQKVAFDAQGRHSGYIAKEAREGGDVVEDWEESCIELWVGGQKNGQGTHVFDNADCQDKCKSTPSNRKDCLNECWFTAGEGDAYERKKKSGGNKNANSLAPTSSKSNEFFLLLLLLLLLCVVGGHFGDIGNGGPGLVARVQAMKKAKVGTGENLYSASPIEANTL